MAVIMNPSLSGDCKAMIVSFQGLKSNTKYYVDLKHVETGETFTQGSVQADADAFSWSGLTSGGVYEVCLTTQTPTGEPYELKRYVVSTCSVDKCMVLLTDQLLSCDCTSPACSALLQKAQKILLLIRSSEATAARITRPEDNVLVTDAQAQYKKAVQFCDSDCDCGC
tara:strand:- start:228 stop:731 length:504 start_codon:yes stop_codon:yes gene_type:complete